MIDNSKMSGRESSGVASTTIPSVSTRQAVPRRRPTHVRWVTPESRAMVLSERVVIGRDESADVRLPGSELSRKHAEFRVDGAIVAVRDLDSSNGVFVDGARTRDARLDVGSVIRCGEWVGVTVAVERGGDPLFFGELASGLWGGHTLRAALEPARRIGPKVPVVIQGATGTGKEGTAAAVHAWSAPGRPFVAINCAAVPESLADGQLFGHAKGAFTGADRDQPGVFREANQGTLFLDEVLELPATLQPKLLRAIDPGFIRRLGDTRDLKVDVRVIVAAQEPLERAVSAGRFRADLHARLNGLTIRLPALGERREDIVPLFFHFLRSQSGGAVSLDPRLAETLCVYEWPANIRELMTTATLMAQLHGREPLLRRSHLPDTVGPRAAERVASEEPSNAANARAPGRTRKPTDDEAEFKAFAAAMELHGSVAKAAQAMGISRSRGYRLLQAHADAPPDDQDDPV